MRKPKPETMHAPTWTASLAWEPVSKRWMLTCRVGAGTRSYVYWRWVEATTAVDQVTALALMDGIEAELLSRLF